MGATWNAWREVDSRRWHLGFDLRLTGADVSFGHRMYRVCWWHS